MNEITRCHHCEKEEILPFKCPYCNHYYCVEHRLPENHNCPEYWMVRAPRPQPPQIATPERPYEYTITYGTRPSKKKFWFSRTEIKHLTLSTLQVVGVGLSWIFLPWNRPGGVNITPEILISLTAIFTSLYLLHEIAHKLTAQHYGLWAEFRLTPFGALITLLSTISPIKVISPGAVLIAGPINREIAGKTALAGPLTNLFLSIISIPFTLYFPSSIAWYSAAFNAWIAFFNLIPFGVMDGLKVFRWKKIVWAPAFITSLILTVFTFVG